MITSDALMQIMLRGTTRVVGQASSTAGLTQMSHFLDRLTFFRKQVDTFSDGHGIVDE